MGDLESAGLIRRGRGRLSILDTEGLERVACECHRAIRVEQQRVVYACTSA